MRDDDKRRGSRNNDQGRTHSFTHYSTKGSRTNVTRSTSSRDKQGKTSGKELKVKKVKKKRKIPGQNQQKYKRLLIITFVVFFIYIAGYMITFFAHPKISTEVVNYGTIDVPKKIQGIIVRDEHVETSQRDGQAVYYYKDGDRVKKDTLVCTVKNAEAVDQINEKIDKVNKEIVSAQKDRESISAFKDDIDKAETKISDTVLDFTNSFNENDFFSVYKLKTSVETEMDKRSQMWFLENNSSVDTLSKQKQAYENELSQNQNNIKSKTSGIVCMSYDGFEDKFTPETLESITSENFKMEYPKEDIINMSNITANSPVFKVIESNVYYIVSDIPSEYAEDISVGSKKVLTTTLDNNEVKSINATVSSVTQQEGYSRVVFKSDEGIMDFMDDRLVEFDISDSANEGIKIPNTAIVEKSLLKIPTTAVFESNNKNCVIKRTNGKDETIELNIAKYDEDDNNPETVEYVYSLIDFNILKVGDVVVNGTGENAGTITLSEVSTYKGVYVVNSSITEFKVIDPIAQNSEYTIVEVTNLPYGLKIYDNIVSDAKMVDEKQEIK